MSLAQLSIRIAAFVLIHCGAALAADPVRITNGEWPPFTSEHLPHGGPLSRIVAEAFALEGVTVEYGYFPWKRSYDYARSGKWDGSVAWEPTTDNVEVFYVSRPLVHVGKALYHLASTPFDWKTIDDLHRWRVGGSAGYSYGAAWDYAVSNHQLVVETVATDEQSLNKLLNHRVDVIAMETEVADYLMRTRLSPAEAGQVRRHPRLLAETPICLALARSIPGNADLMTRFNRGLQRLKDSGQHAIYLEQTKSMPASTQTPAAGGKRLSR